MADKEAVVVDGVPVTHGSCCCGHVPTEEEVKGVVAEFLKAELQRCGRCKEAFTLKNLSLIHPHIAGRGEVNWRVGGWRFADVVCLIPPGLSGKQYEIWLHLDCFQQLFPNYEGIDQLKQMMR